MNWKPFVLSEQRRQKYLFQLKNEKKNNKQTNPKPTPNHFVYVSFTCSFPCIIYQLCSGLDQPLVHTKDKSQSLKNK